SPDLPGAPRQADFDPSRLADRAVVVFRDKALVVHAQAVSQTVEDWLHPVREIRAVAATIRRVEADVNRDVALAVVIARTVSAGLGGHVCGIAPLLRDAGLGPVRI